MTRKQNRPFVPSLMLGTFLLSVMAVFLAAPSSATTRLSPPETAPLEEEMVEVAPLEEEGDAVVEPLPAEASPKVGATSAVLQPKTAWSDYPNACETFTVIEGTKRVKTKKGKLRYPIRFRRNRFDRKRSHQKSTRDLIRMVAREMGADEAGQYLVETMAHHESSWNPEAIHILNRDLQANLDSWERHSYDRAREQQLVDKIQKTSAKTQAHWKLRARLVDLRMYKNNPFWDSQLEYVHRIPERTLHGETTPAMEFTEHRSVWAYGYGLFGMNSVLFTHVWDSEAPPWILCGDEGIVATVTAIWALRNHQEDCAYLSVKDPKKYGTDGGTARGIMRRFARGHCSDKKLGGAWQRLMATNTDHVDWDGSPDLGNKFPRYEKYRKNGKWYFRYETETDPETGDPKVDAETGKPAYKRNGRGRKIKIPTDRQAILAHMRTKAQEKGFLRPAPLKPKKPRSKGRGGTANASATP